MPEAENDAIQKARRDAMQDARRAAVKAVLNTTVSREAAEFDAPDCHKRGCREAHAPDALVGLVLARAADEVERALILEFDEDAARLDHQRDAWDEGYMHVMKHGTGRNTRGMNPYLAEEDR